MTDNLLDSFIEYMNCWQSGNTREKINFAILLDDGSTKHITLRPEDNCIEVYGDFEGMPNFLEWAERFNDNGE